MKKAVKILFLSMIWTGIIWRQPLQTEAETLSEPAIRAAESDEDFAGSKAAAQTVKAEILSVAVSGSSDLTVSWKEIPEAAAYHIYRSTEENLSSKGIREIIIRAVKWAAWKSEGKTYLSAEPRSRIIMR